MTSLDGIARIATAVRGTLRARHTVGLARAVAGLVLLAPAVALATVDVTDVVFATPVTTGPGATSVAIDSFGIRSNTTSNVTVTSVTVTFTSTSTTAQEWVQAVRITQNADGTGTLYGTGASPTSNAITITTTGFTAPRSAQPALTAYVVLDLKTVPTGTAGTTTNLAAYVSNVTTFGSTTDTAANSVVVTVDNGPPSNATWGTNTGGAGQVTLNWTNPGADFGQVVIARRTTSTFTSAPSEGVLPAVTDTWADGSVVVYVGTATTITDPVAAGTYYYKIFAGDQWENWSAGVATGALTSSGASNTTVLGSGSDPGAATICPGAAATYVDQLTFTVTGTNDTVTALTVPLAGTAGVGGAVSQVELRTSAGASFAPAKIATIAGDTATFSGAALPANAGSTTYTLYATPNGHAGITGSPTLQARVSGFTATNSTSGSDTASTFTLDNTAATNPGWGTVTAGNAQVVLNWTNPGGDAVQVMVVRATAVPSGAPTDGQTYAVNDAIGNGAVVYVGPSASPLTFTDSTAANGTPYWYEIYARDACLNWSSGAPTATSYTPAGIAAPSAPGAISFSAVTQTSMTVSWGAATGVAPITYKLERALDAGGAPGTWAQIFTPAGTSQADSGLTPGATYWYRVRANNVGAGGGDGPYNAAAAQATSPATTTVGDGTNPSAASLCPGGAATQIDAFTLSSTGMADSISGVTVNLSPAGAYQNVGTVEVTDDSGASVKGSATPASNSVLVNLGSAIASPIGPATQYKIRITPKAHSAMPVASNGQSYATTALVGTVAGLNPGPAVGDATSGTVTVDNRSPGTPGWGAITTASGSVTLAWTNPADADFSQVIVLRKAGGPVTDVPVEGTTYANNATIGSSTVVYVGTATTSGALTVTNGTSYYFKIFAKDGCANYSAGAQAGPILAGTPAVEGDPTKGTQKATLAIVNPGKNVAVSGTFKVQIRVFNPNTAEAVSLSGLSLNTDGSATTFPVLPTANVTAFTRNSNYGSATNSGVFEATVSGLAAGSYTLRARSTNAAGSTNSAAVPVRVNASKAGDGNILRRDNSSQLCNDCHVLAPHSSETSGSQYGSWATVCADCHAPHGTTNIYLVDNPITPPAVNGYQPPKPVYLSSKTGYSATGGASNKTSAALANGDNTGVCQACHTRTASLTGAARFRNTGAADGHYTSEPATTSVSMTTAPCSACHQHSTGFAPTGKHCKDCHLGAPGAADVDSYAWGDSLAALISVDEWTSRGHGASAAYVSGNPGAGFDTKGNLLGDRGCLYCHSSSTSHDDATNFFRLNPASYNTTSVRLGGDGWNSVCLVCHGKTATWSSTGFDPDGAGTDYTLINGTKRLGYDHYGPSHSSPDSNGGNYCWDCHDPHGDKSATGADLWFMIQKLPVEQTTGTNSGVPQTFAAAIEFRGGLGGDLTRVDFPDYIYVSGTSKGLCRNCHDSDATPTDTINQVPGVNHYTKTTTDGHNSATGVGLSPRDRCTDCHVHAKACNECHNAPVPVVDRHAKHNELGALPTAYTETSSEATATQYGYRCAKCHVGTHPKDTHAGTLADPYWVDVVFDGNSNPKNPAPASYTRGTSQTAVQGVANGDYSNSYWSWTDGTCASVYCHSNGAPLGGTNAFTTVTWVGSAATTCASCHDTAGAATTLSVAHRVHTDPAKYNLGCERCHTATGTKTVLTNKANHVNGLKDVAFDTAGVNNGAGTYSGATAYTCSNTYCHSNGQDRAQSGGGAPYVSGPSTAWNATTTCTSCHPAASTTLTSGMHAPHINNASVIGTNFVCVNCHATVTGAGAAPTALAGAGAYALHVDGLATVSFSAMGPIPAGGTYSGGSCSAFYCHSSGQATPSYNTIAWNAAALGCNGCHGKTTTAGQPDLGTANSHTAKHVPATNPQTSCPICHATTTANGTSIVLASAKHIDGYRDVGFSGIANGGTYGGAVSKTCSVYCHSNAGPLQAGGTYAAPTYVSTVAWGATSPNCAGCHGGAGAATTMSAAHAKHVNSNAAGGYGFTCNKCHYATTQNGTTILAGSTKHVDGVKTDVVFNTADAFTPVGSTWAAAGHTCASTYCHGNMTGGINATPAWNAGTLACTGCHGVPPGNHGAGDTDCNSCHPGYTQTTVVLATHANGTVDGGGGCMGCHGSAKDDVAVPGSRRAVTPDFAKTSHHVGNGSTYMGGTLTDNDCAVCHAEANVPGTKGGSVSAGALHKNGVVDLRDADNNASYFQYDVNTIKGLGTAGANSNNATWRSEMSGRTDNLTGAATVACNPTGTGCSKGLDRFCISCHDANGASAANLAGDATATALNPFADTKISNDYDQAIRCDPGTGGTACTTANQRVIDIAIRVSETANGVAATDRDVGTASVTNRAADTRKDPPEGVFSRHAIRGLSVSVYGGTVTASVDSPTGCGGAGCFNTTRVAWASNSVMGCADCHTVDGANTTNGNAHGSNSEYLLKDGGGTATEPANAAYASYYCANCHKGSFYAGGAGHTANGGDWQDYANLTGTARIPASTSGGNLYGYACGNCHGGGAPSKTGSTFPTGSTGVGGFGTIHGTSQIFGQGSVTGTARPAYRFTNGNSMRYYTVADWTTATSRTCYTIGSGDTWGGCTKHTAGGSRTVGAQAARPLTY